MIPIGTDYRMSSRPWVNYALLAANIALFLLGYNSAGKENFNRITHLMLHPDNPELFQFFSSMFLHAHWGHLLGNMVFLWVFGNALNDRFGHLGYLMFYLAGGILAGIGYLLLSGHAPVLGASGAISAVTGAYLVLFPRTRVTVLIWFFYILMPMEITSLLFLMFQFVVNLWMSLSTTLTGQSAGAVAYVAHSSGYVFGIVVAAALLALKIIPRDVYDMLNLIHNWRRRAGYHRMTSAGYDPFNPGGISGAPGGRRVKTRTVDTSTPSTATAREFNLRKEIADAWRRNDLQTAAEKYLELTGISEKPVLSREQQLDVANQLMSTRRYSGAAQAYRTFLEHYKDYPYLGDIYLMLGLIYGRYLNKYDQAEQYLDLARRTLSDPQKSELAAGELQAVRRARRQ